MDANRQEKDTSKFGAVIVKIGSLQIEGLDNVGPAQLEQLLLQGARFVFFEYCVSFVIFTMRRPSSICLLRPDEWGWLRGLPYTLLSLVCGWWGLPWGLIYTPIVLVHNMAGGCDVTAQVCALMRQPPKCDGVKS